MGVRTESPMPQADLAELLPVWPRVLGALYPEFSQSLSWPQAHLVETFASRWPSQVQFSWMTVTVG